MTERTDEVVAGWEQARAKHVGSLRRHGAVDTARGELVEGFDVERLFDEMVGRGNVALHDFGCTSTLDDEQVRAVFMTALYTVADTAGQMEKYGALDHHQWHGVLEAVEQSSFALLHVMHGPVPPEPIPQPEPEGEVRCPGPCGRVLHGAIAKRGACTSCFPEVGDIPAIDLSEMLRHTKREDDDHG